MFSHVAGSMQVMGFKHSFTSANIEVPKISVKIEILYTTAYKLPSLPPPPAPVRSPPIIGPSTCKQTGHMVIKKKKKIEL